MQTTFKLFVSFLLGLVMSFVSGCGSQSSSALVDRWESESGWVFWGGGTLNSLELTKDGTGIVNVGMGKGTNIPITWKAENGRFFLTGSGNAGVWDYRISGMTLTLTTDNGTSIEYKKHKRTTKGAAASEDAESEDEYDVEASHWVTSFVTFLLGEDISEYLHNNRSVFFACIFIAIFLAYVALRITYTVVKKSLAAQSNRQMQKDTQEKKEESA